MRAHPFEEREGRATCARCSGGRLLSLHDMRDPEQIIDSYAVQICAERGLVWRGTERFAVIVAGGQSSGIPVLWGGIQESYL